MPTYITYKNIAGNEVMVEKGSQEDLNMQKLNFEKLGEKEIGVSRYEDPLAKKEEEYYTGLDITAPTAKEEGIREDVRSQMQTQIDALNAYYADLIASEETKGAETLKKGLGMRGAIVARSGLEGSPMGEAMMMETEKTLKGYTAEQVRLLGEEKQLKLSAILNKIDERATEEIRLEKQETAANVEKYFNYLRNVRSEARTDVANLAKTGTSLDVLKTQPYYTQLKKETGWGDFLFDTLYNYNLTEARKINYNYSWKGDNLVAIGLDPATGKLKTETYSAKDLGIPVGTDFDIIINDITGKVYWWDKNQPDSGLKEMGNVGQRKEPAGTTIHSGNLEIAESDVAKAQSQLDQSRGSDGYVNTKLYLDMLTEWKNKGGLEQDFYTNFSPKNYLNPNDPTIPQYIKDKLKSTEDIGAILEEWLKSK